jgi:flagellar hook-basal body complex protein FliE
MSAAIHAVAEIAANTNMNLMEIAAPKAGFSTFNPAKAAPTEMPFSDLLTDAVSQINGLESRARAAADGLITGTGVDVHQAMIAAEKASMAFELALAVRNKAVQAYQSVMSMQF